AKQHEAGARQHAAQGQQQDGRIDVDLGRPEGHGRALKNRSAHMPATTPATTAAASPSRKGSTCPVQATTPAASMDTSIGLELASGTVIASSASTAAKSSDHPVGTMVPR